VVAALSAVTSDPGPAAADPPSPHLDGGAVTDTCAACHRTHSGQNDALLASIPQDTLCFSCHDGTGSAYNVAAEYSDPSVPPNDPLTSSYYSHTSPDPTTHTSARDDEFAGVLNRHAVCSDCHSPHSLTSMNASPTASGWLASGALTGTMGVEATAPPAKKDPLTLEYELCLKCHSSYTQLLTFTDPSEQKQDKAAEIALTNESFHPILAPGKNTTTAMDASLAGGTLWQYTKASTVRCVNCHANSGLLADSPASDGKLAPHASQNRGLLLANYRDRALKPSGEPYGGTDFQLCFLCHGQGPFSTSSENPRADTNFQLHGKHMTSISGDPSGNPLDIDLLGAGEGNSLCSECHFQLHSTKLAPYAGNQSYERGVNFAPNVGPRPPASNPEWSGPTSRTCALVCHGQDHDAEAY
jgi:predicted CXXCH cytochrome family protein